MESVNRQELPIATFVLFTERNEKENTVFDPKLFHFNITKSDWLFANQIRIVLKIPIGQEFSVFVEKDNKIIKYNSDILKRKQKPLKDTFGELQEYDKDRGFLSRILIKKNDNEE